MTYVFSGVAPARTASPTAVPPPLPVGDRSATASSIDETDEDMRRLAADISRVLSGRPDLRIVGVQATGVTVAVEGGLPLTAEDKSAHPFERQAFALADGPRAADTAVGWLARAKRERRSERLRSALSWCVALAIAGGIVAVVAGSVRTGVSLFGALEAIRRTFGL